MIKALKKRIALLDELIAAAIQAKSVELREYSKKYEKQQYWIGYKDGLRDGKGL